MSKTFRKKNISNRFYDFSYTNLFRTKSYNTIISGDDLQPVLICKYCLTKVEIEKNSPRWKKEYALAHRDKITPNVPKHYRVTLERKLRRKMKDLTLKATQDLEKDIVHPKNIKNVEWYWY